MNFDKRTRARELAMQALYQLDVQGTVFLDSLKQFFTESQADDFVCSLALQWTQGAWKNLPQCDRLIADSAIKWRLSRLSMVDRSILRLAVFQLKFCPDIPAKVAINEAIELAKKFSTAASPAFVNGVLDAALKKIKSQR